MILDKSSNLQREWLGRFGWRRTDDESLNRPERRRRLQVHFSSAVVWCYRSAAAGRLSPRAERRFDRAVRSEESAAETTKTTSYSADW